MQVKQIWLTLIRHCLFSPSFTLFLLHFQYTIRRSICRFFCLPNNVFFLIRRALRPFCSEKIRKNIDRKTVTVVRKICSALGTRKHSYQWCFFQRQNLPNSRRWQGYFSTRQKTVIGNWNSPKAGMHTNSYAQTLFVALARKAPELTVPRLIRLRWRIDLPFEVCLSFSHIFSFFHY